MENKNLYEGLKNYNKDLIDYCPIDKLNPYCLARIFQFLNYHDRLTVEQGKLIILFINEKKKNFT